MPSLVRHLRPKCREGYNGQKAHDVEYHAVRKRIPMKRSMMLLLSILISLLAACQSRTPSADEVATAIEATTMMKKTLEPDTSTPTDAPSETPTITFTNTPAPSPTATESLHPIQIYEDFSSREVEWLACDVCEWKNDALYMGPYPASGAYQTHVAICKECGEVTYYRMAVVATYIDGPTDRGYGMILRWTDDYVITLEISPWQTVGAFKYEFDSDRWEILDGRWAGAVKAGTSPNRIEVFVTQSQQRRTDISVAINGKNVFIVWNEPKDQSPVGLMLFGHALEVSFDDFEFEEYEPYGDPIELEDLDRPSG